MFHLHRFAAAVHLSCAPSYKWNNRRLAATSLQRRQMRPIAHSQNYFAEIKRAAIKLVILRSKTARYGFAAEILPLTQPMETDRKEVSKMSKGTRRMHVGNESKFIIYHVRCSKVHTDVVCGCRTGAETNVCLCNLQHTQQQTEIGMGVCADQTYRAAASYLFLFSLCRAGNAQSFKQTKRRKS